MIEVMITLGISTLVVSSILGILISQSNAEKRVSTFADNQEQLRQTVVAMQRDIRSSEPLKQLPTSPEYALRIDLHVYDNILMGDPTPLRWRVDTATKELRRELLDEYGNVTAVTHRLTNVSNNAALPLFAFYKANGGFYDLNADQPRDISECTIRVHIDLVASPAPGPDPSHITSDAELRNRLPGGIGCPQTLLVTTTTTTP